MAVPTITGLSSTNESSMEVTWDPVADNRENMKGRIAGYTACILLFLTNASDNMGSEARKRLRTTKAQTSLPIRAVWSAPLLFAFWKV